MRSGIAERVMMQTTRSVTERYNILGERELKDVAGVFVDLSDLVTVNSSAKNPESVSVSESTVRP